MGVNVEPSVSLLISELRKISSKARTNKVLLEVKRLAAKNSDTDELLLIDLWKKLYFHSIGFKINILDFIKACGSNSILIKRLGYQGITTMQPTKELVILQNTVLKDLENEDFISEALIFLSNIHDVDQIFKDIANKIVLSSENMKHFRKLLIAKSKYSDLQFFELKSENELNLFVKLQIILDNEFFGNFNIHLGEYLIQCLKRLNCQYTKLKILQVLQKMVQASHIIFNEASISKIRSFIFSLNSKSKKQIEIAICIESIKLLLISGNRYDGLDEFIFTLINSKSLNSNYLGLKLATEFKINPEITISKIIELGIEKNLYFKSLEKLIDHSTYSYVFQRLKLESEHNQNDLEKMKQREINFLKILKRVCDYGDQEFICSVLYKYPKVYELIRNEKLLKPEQSRSFFKILMGEDNPDFYLMIYDLFPSKSNSDELVFEICNKHLSRLIELTQENVPVLIDNLFTFLCLHGNPARDRQECLNILNQNMPVKIHKEILKMLVEGILRFNIVLNTKMIYLDNFNFLEYQIIDKNLLIILPLDFFNFSQLTVINAEKISEKTEKGKLVEMYEICNDCEMRVKTSLGTIVKSIDI